MVRPEHPPGGAEAQDEKGQLEGALAVTASESQVAAGEEDRAEHQRQNDRADDVADSPLSLRRLYLHLALFPGLLDEQRHRTAPVCSRLDP